MLFIVVIYVIVRYAVYFCYLTNSSLYMKCIKVVFQYLKMLQELGPQKRFADWNCTKIVAANV